MKKPKQLKEMNPVEYRSWEIYMNLKRCYSFEASGFLTGYFDTFNKTIDEIKKTIDCIVDDRNQ